MIYGIIAAFWIITSVLSYGICLFWHKRDYDYFRYGLKWRALDLLGPISL